MDMQKLRDRSDYIMAIVSFEMCLMREKIEMETLKRTNCRKYHETLKMLEMCAYIVETLRYETEGSGRITLREYQKRLTKEMILRAQNPRFDEEIRKFYEKENEEEDV